MPPEHDVVKKAAENNVRNKNYLREMKVNFKLISNRWVKRRDDQIKRLNNYQVFLSKILLTIKYVG